MNELTSAVTVQFGSIYTRSGNIIEHPALIIDQSTDCGTLVAWGDFSYVEAKYKRTVQSYLSAGYPTDKLILIALDNFAMSREEQCYVLRRCIEYTASGFHNKLCEMLTNGENALTWLSEEMKRVPIDVKE